MVVKFYEAMRMKVAMDEEKSVSDIKVDLRASVIKPLHANWVISAICILSPKKETLKKPFEKIVISENFEKWNKIVNI